MTKALRGAVLVGRGTKRPLGNAALRAANLKGGQVNGYFAGRRAEVQQFMAQQECSWCASPLKVRIMSKFNTDAICMSCKNKERAHPDYPKAEAAERAAVMAGDFNFPGIGKPVDL